MSVHLGVNPGYPDEFNSYCSGSPPPVSYLYNSDRTAYRFADSHMDDLSLLPVIEIKGKKVIFTINPQPTLYYDNGFINSLPELFQKIKFPQNLDQEMLDKIAIIANYLSLGGEYQYLPPTAKQQNDELTFLVKRGEKEYCRVTIPSFKDHMKAQYEEIEKEQILSCQY